MFGTTWLAYFEGNARPDAPPSAALIAELAPDLREDLCASLGRFQLGESAGGKIHEDVATLRDPELDAPTRRAIQLYVEEEWRHARELAGVIHALGGRLQSAHWTSAAFTACRRLLGLRTKLMTLAIAEVIGIVYYRALADRAGSPALAAPLRRIAGEESRHLDFQAAYFDRVLELTPRLARAMHRVLLRGLMLAVFFAASVVLLLDHRRLLARLDVRAGALFRDSWRELASRQFLAAGRPPLALAVSARTLPT
jgi:rubrerythrin